METPRASAGKPSRSKKPFPLKLSRRKRRLNRAAMALNELVGFAPAPSVAYGERARISANLLETAIGQTSTPPALDTNL